MNFHSQFSKDEPLHFFATSYNRHPFFYCHRDFPVSHFNYLTYDNHSIDKCLQLTPLLIPNATHTPHIPSSTPPPSNIPITTQPSSSHSPHQYNTPSISPPTYTITTQPTISQIHQPLPPIPLSFRNIITTQPQTHSSQTFLATALSDNLPPLHPPFLFLKILPLRLIIQTHHSNSVFIIKILFSTSYVGSSHHLILPILLILLPLNIIRKFFQ